jgi:hypothetical protein
MYIRPRPQIAPADEIGVSSPHHGFYPSFMSTLGSFPFICFFASLASLVTFSLPILPCMFSAYLARLVMLLPPFVSLYHMSHFMSSAKKLAVCLSTSIDYADTTKMNASKGIISPVVSISSIQESHGILHQEPNHYDYSRQPNKAVRHRYASKNPQIQDPWPFYCSLNSHAFPIAAGNSLIHKLTAHTADIIHELDATTECSSVSRGSELDLVSGSRHHQHQTLQNSTV